MFMPQGCNEEKMKEGERKKILVKKDKKKDAS